MNNIIRNIIMGVVFVICLALIVVGQKSICVQGLVMELAGLAGLLTLLFVYNHRYSK